MRNTDPTPATRNPDTLLDAVTASVGPTMVPGGPATPSPAPTTPSYPDAPAGSKLAIPPIPGPRRPSPAVPAPSSAALSQTAPAGVPAQVPASSSPAQSAVPDPRQLASLPGPEPAAQLRRRPIPRRLIAVLIGAALLLIWLLAGSRTRRAKGGRRAILPVDTVINEADLVHRREVSAADFAPRSDGLLRARSFRPAASAIPDGATSDPSAAALAERRARREADPEDLRRRAARATASADHPDPSPPLGPAMFRRRRLAIEPGADPEPAGAASRGIVHASAGTSIDAEITTQLQLTSGSRATVVAEVAEGSPIPAGTRVLGAATANGDRVSIRFRKAVLPDGREIDIEAEAQDASGTAGVPAAVHGGESPSRDAAGDAAGDAISDVLGSGIVGRAVDDVTRSQRRLGRRTPTVLTVESGTSIRILLLDSLHTK